MWKTTSLGLGNGGWLNGLLTVWISSVCWNCCGLGREIGGDSTLDPLWAGSAKQSEITGWKKWSLLIGTREVRELGLEKERFRGNICWQFHWGGGGSVRKREGRGSESPPTLSLSFLKRKQVWFDADSSPLDQKNRSITICYSYRKCE